MLEVFSAFNFSILTTIPKYMHHLVHMQARECEPNGSQRFVP